MQTYSRINRISNIRYGVTGFFRQNKIKIFVLIFLAILGILTGIFTALKCGVDISNIQGYNLSIYANGNIFSFDIFFTRMLSHIVVIAVISLGSLSIFLLPISYLLFIYRGYSIGFNCTLLIVLFGFSGMFTSIVIIIPCQIALTFLFIVYFCLMIDRAIQRKRFGYCEKPKFLKLFFVMLIILILLNLIETLLLILLNARTILII